MSGSAILAAATPDGAATAGELTSQFGQLADQAFLLAGSGVALGLGVGITVSGATVYLYKRKQIQDKLQA